MVVRNKDQQKQQAIISATIDLVNEIGFAASSVAKIAKRAKVSPASLYVYYENKEDLLVSTYVQIKHCMGQAIMEGFAPEADIQTSLLRAGRNLFSYINDHRAMFYFAEQFSNSPYQDQVPVEAIEASFGPFYTLLEKGITEGQIKDVPMAILLAHLYAPLQFLVNPRHNPTFKATQDDVDACLRMAWDAVRT